MIRALQYLGALKPEDTILGFVFMNYAWGQYYLPKYYLWQFENYNHSITIYNTKTDMYLLKDSSSSVF